MVDEIATAEIYEKTGVANMARITRTSDGELLTRADLGSPGGITYSIYDLSSDTPATAVVSGASLSPVATYFFDTLQTQADDAAWSRDDVGYNFKHVLDGGLVFLQGGRHYLIEYVFSTAAIADEPNVRAVFRVKTVSFLTS